jgi:hypothetical protein
MKNDQHPVPRIIILMSVAFGFKLLVWKSIQKVVNSHKLVVRLRYEFRYFPVGNES